VYYLQKKTGLGLIPAWEEGRHERNRKILSRICGQEEMLYIFTEVVLGIIENLIQRIILFDEDIPYEKVKKEIGFVLELYKPEK
jgi:hypothetical protein